MVALTDHPSPAPLSPREDSGRDDRDLIGRIATSKIFRDYQRAFRATVGMPLVIQAAELIGLPPGQIKTTTRCCTLLGPRNMTCAGCAQMEPWTADDTHNEARTAQCHWGLTESAVPIRIGERVVGFLHTGRVRLRPPSAARFPRLLASKHGRPPDVEATDLRVKYLATRVVTRTHYDSALRLLIIFAQHLALLGNQLLIATIAAESPMVAKARRFIAENHGEKLSLKDVARAVHTSHYYLCKRFKQETGLGFTHYLARVRIEKVKQSLLHQHIRITEAAFAAGFQSLSQFNRKFRRVVGESPSAYRIRVAADGNSPAVCPRGIVPRFRSPNLSPTLRT